MYSFFAWRHWKQAVVLWMPFSLLFNECICLRYTSPALTVNLAIIIVLTSIFYVQRKELILSSKPYIFNTAFKAYIVSYVLSMFFSIVPFQTVFLNTVKYFLQTFFFIYLFSKALNSEKEIRLFTYGLIIVVIFFTAIGIIEAIIGDNPYLDYVYINAPTDEVAGKMWYRPPWLSLSESGMRFGLRRCFSVFRIHIAYGCASAMLLFYFIFVSKQCKFIGVKLYWVNISILCLLVSVFLSNSKTPMLGLLLFPLAFISYRQLLKIKYIAPFVGFIIVFFFYFPDYFNTLFSLFDNELAEEGGGSTTAMRALQFKAGINLFYQNPILGNGVGALSVFSTEDILGAESSWLKILPERGIIGIVVYLILYLQIFNILKKYYSFRVALIFCAALGMMETATGFMDFSIYAGIIVAVVRYKQLETTKLNKIYITK